MNMRLFLTLLFLPLSLFGQSAAERRTPLERSLEQRGLVDVSVAVPGVFVSLMYARPDNFVGRVLYTDLHRAYLLPETARALHRAQTALQRKYPDYALKVYDAARPMRIQQRMWNAVAGTSKNIYVSNPARGGGLHNGRRPHPLLGARRTRWFRSFAPCSRRHHRSVHGNAHRLSRPRRPCSR